jgi:hypothetical protein
MVPMMRAMSQWRSGPQSWTGAKSKPEVSLSRPPPGGMLTVIDITHVHLGAGAALVQPFSFCSANHSTEPGWGTL